MATDNLRYKKNKLPIVCTCPKKSSTSNKHLQNKFLDDKHGYSDKIIMDFLKNGCAFHVMSFVPLNDNIYVNNGEVLYFCTHKHLNRNTIGYHYHYLMTKKQVEDSANWSGMNCIIKSITSFSYLLNVMRYIGGKKSMCNNFKHSKILTTVNQCPILPLMLHYIFGDLKSYTNKIVDFEQLLATFHPMDKLKFFNLKAEHGLPFDEEKIKKLKNKKNDNTVDIGNDVRTFPACIDEIKLTKLQLYLRKQFKECAESKNNYEKMKSFNEQVIEKKPKRNVDTIPFTMSLRSANKTIDKNVDQCPIEENDSIKRKNDEPIACTSGIVPKKIKIEQQQQSLDNNDDEDVVVDEISLGSQDTDTDDDSDYDEYTEDDDDDDDDEEDDDFSDNDSEDYMSEYSSETSDNEKDDDDNDDDETIKNSNVDSGCDGDIVVSEENTSCKETSVGGDSKKNTSKNKGRTINKNLIIRVNF